MEHRSAVYGSVSRRDFLPDDELLQDQSENDQVSIGCLLSIGTGMNEPQPMDMIDFNFSLVGNPFSTATAMRNLGVILIDQVGWLIDCS